jgi:putative DNA primase/helicase
MVWPDAPRSWKLVDRPPNSAALSTAERVFSRVAHLSCDDPVRLHFAAEAQELFFSWLGDLERRIRGSSGLDPAMIGHLAKYRGLVPRLAALFEVADRLDDSADVRDEVPASLEHTRQAIAFSEYLESHANRVYSCMVSPEARAARELARHLTRGDLPEEFTARSMYLKGWSGLDTPERARAALGVLEEAGWIRRKEIAASPAGGRPTDIWMNNPKVRSGH